MPEGDTYTLAADRIRPVLVGQALTRVAGSAADVRRRSSALLGATVDGVRTLGKHLLIDIDNGLTIHIHLGMPGRVTLGSDADGPGVRLALGTEAGAMSVRAAPDVDVDRRKVIDHELRRIGADLLAPEFDWPRFRERAGLYPDDRAVSDFLLDQRVMAGIGNVYKCETLWAEKLDPARTMDTVDSATRDSLAKRARELMLPNAHRFERSTAGRGQLWVYGREGWPCPRCQTRIEAGWVGEPTRITYWCPSCQQ